MSEKRPVYQDDISIYGQIDPIFITENPLHPLPSLNETSKIIAYANFIRANNIPYIETLIEMPNKSAIPCEVYKLRDGEREDTILITDGFMAWIDEHGVFLKSVPFTYFVRK